MMVTAIGPLTCATHMGVQARQTKLNYLNAWEGLLPTYFDECSFAVMEISFGATFSMVA